MLKKYTAVFAIALGALSIASTAQAEPKNLKFAVFTPPAEPTFEVVMVPFAKGASADSGGTIQIDTFPGGTLGKNPVDQLKLTLSGVVDIAWIVTSYTPGRFPDNDVFELPGLFKNVNEAANAGWRMFEKGLLRGYDDIFVVGLFQTNPYFLHTKQKVEKLDDIKGLKVRAAGPVFGAAFKALGATPVGMPAPAIAENISRGVIDGTALEFNGHYAFRVKDVAKFTLTSSTGDGLFGTATLAAVMNKKVFDSLPAQARDAILKHRGREMVKNFAKLHDSMTAKLKAATDKDPELTLTALSSIEQERFDAKMAEVVREWANGHDRGKELLAAVRAEVDAIRNGK